MSVSSKAKHRRTRMSKLAAKWRANFKISTGLSESGGRKERTKGGQGPFNFWNSEMKCFFSQTGGGLGRSRLFVVTELGITLSSFQPRSSTSWSEVSVSSEAKHRRTRMSKLTAKWRASFEMGMESGGRKERAKGGPDPSNFWHSQTKCFFHKHTITVCVHYS